MAQVVVTTGRNSTDKEESLGRIYASELKTIFVERNNYSIESLKTNYQAESIIVIAKNGPIIYTSAGEYYFHLNMAELRIRNLKNGKPDHMAEAMDLFPGAAILDCTLGLATDAIVTSYCVGKTGKVVGLEISPLIALISKVGLQNHCSDFKELNESLRRIRVENTDYNSGLAKYENRSFDTVYFDPMFRRPINESSNMKPLRVLADNRPITLDAVREAIRVARRRVVIKETQGSNEFNRLGVDTVVGGKYSSVSYGIIRTGG
ncbi:Ribosomal RNA small subunit methyltransferase J [bioreactor metagenome]|uniref:Ribosomal RNA small subunit methyltransferase J n=1 Tax=bioreactor metagenome TaxID=1076179 RepID=A0A644T0W4_9ZZZZ|nr:class I SAM-dependent methyltransferase [Negativicutes bacterium]